MATLVACGSGLAPDPDLLDGDLVGTEVETGTDADTSVQNDPACNDTCSTSSDGVCQDGGPGAQSDVCSLGTDCTDCGSRAPECGNGLVESSEVCDGLDLAGQTCQTQGFDSGVLACASDCGAFDVIGCSDGSTCGDGSIEGREECEGSALAGGTCSGEGFTGGLLGCNPTTCMYDTSGCYDCGNGSQEFPEDCDGGDLNGATCASVGFTSGPLSCTSSCTFDTSSCAGSIGCVTQNGVREGAEQCDELDLAGASCGSLGFGSGLLLCTGQCVYDTTACGTGASSVCNESCSFDDDGDCDDGGPGADYNLCDYGSDCIDCGARPDLSDVGGICDNTCSYNDGVCNDGGSSSLGSTCALGTDCLDCGIR